MQSKSLSKELLKKLKEDIKKSRYAHSVSVQYTAACLCMRYGHNMEKAMLAGILHDCAKHLSEAELLEECNRNHIAVSEGEERNPYLLHAKMGVHLARTVYGVEDEEVLSAIRYHTTGRPKMAWLEKIILVSDFIEPNRKLFTELTEIRKQAFLDLNKTVALILQATIRHLENEQVCMDEMTNQTFRYYKKYI